MNTRSLLENRQEGQEVGETNYGGGDLAINIMSNGAQKTPEVNCMTVSDMVTIQWLIFVCILGCLITALLVTELRKFLIWDLPLWKWCVFLLVVISGMFIIKLSIGFIVSMIKIHCKDAKIFFFVHSLRKSGAWLVWILSVFLVWVCLIDPGLRESFKSTSMILDCVTWTLLSVLLGSFLFVLKTLGLKFLLSRFQISAYLKRIINTLFVQHVLDVLSKPPSIKKVSEVRNLLSLRSGKISSWKVSKLVRDVTKSTLYVNSPESENCVAKIQGELAARLAASIIFGNVATSNEGDITQDDLSRFMEEEEVETLTAPEEQFAWDGNMSKKALGDLLVSAFREREALTHALKDTKKVIEQLNKLLSGIFAVVVFVMWLLALGITNTTTIALFVTAVSFTFGNTLKNIFEATVFVFVVHPFDVGDRCFIDGSHMVVEEIRILTTAFLKSDNEKVYYPNSLLATKSIGNYYRSPHMSESVVFTIDFATPAEKIEKLKGKLNRYCEEKNDEWQISPTVVIKEKENENKLQLVVYCTHTMNFQDYYQRQIRRTKLVLALKKMFEELNIQYACDRTEPSNDLVLLGTH